jgi:hypothetical protein
MCSSFLEAPYVMLSSFLEAAYVMIYHSWGPCDHPSSIYTRRGPCGIIQNYSFERPMKIEDNASYAGFSAKDLRYIEF